MLFLRSLIHTQKKKKKLPTSVFFFSGVTLVKSCCCMKRFTNCEKKKKTWKDSCKSLIKTIATINACRQFFRDEHLVNAKTLQNSEKIWKRMQVVSFFLRCPPPKKKKKKKKHAKD